MRAVTQDHPWGWRMSIGLAGVPALVFLIGSCILDDSPNSLLLNYKETKGRQARPIRPACLRNVRVLFATCDRQTDSATLKACVQSSTYH